jgi:glycosyltransferase involved in cell wall biosynthesis
MPSISIVVSTYRRPKTIMRLLDILNQQVRYNLHELEVCVVDDGSPESLEGKFGEYLYKFQYIYRERAAGDVSRVYSSRNLAAANTSGAMVLQLDDDVTFHERTLSELQNMAAIFEFFAPNLHWLMSPRLSNNKDFVDHPPEGLGKDRGGFHFGPEGHWKDGKVRFMDVSFPGTSSCMMFMPRRTWNLVGGYDEEFDGCMGAADQELALRVAQAGGYCMLGPYYAHIEDEETDSWRGRMIDKRKRPKGNDILFREKHPDMDAWADVDYWHTQFELTGDLQVNRK